MNTHRYVLLLGSSLPTAHVMQQARDLLSKSGLIEALSECVHAPSVVPGDTRQFHNQALVVAVDWPRAGVPAQLKQIEAALGRNRESEQCAIDIDLACECDGQGNVLWRDPAKLNHPLFLGQMQEVLNRLRGPSKWSS